MKLSLSLITLLLLTACNGGGEVSSGSSSSKAINQEAPYIWGNKTFPKVVAVSSSFSDPKEVEALQEMADAWKTAVNNTEFIRLGSTISNAFDINEDDGVMGFYKATTWPSDISDDALAITNLFGRRYNIGDSDEYVKIVEADIIMNYSLDYRGDRNFEFDYDLAGSTSGYDFRGVILHEMGHFLGLQHVPTYSNRPDADQNLSSPQYKATSVMYPSVSSSDAKRVPQTKDINALAYKYGIGGSGMSAMTAASKTYQPRDQGESIRIVIELRKTGECIHKHDGTVVKRHHVNLK
jgi:hypothetical protein